MNCVDETFNMGKFYKPKVSIDTGTFSTNTQGWIQDFGKGGPDPQPPPPPVSAPDTTRHFHIGVASLGLGHIYTDLLIHHAKFKVFHLPSE